MAEARWAYDGSAQGGKKIAFGNTWVIAALVVRLPCCPSPVALPVLFRLWRGKGTASQVQLAAGLMELLVKAFPGRQVHGTGDAAFHGEPLVIKGSTWTTRLPASAVISGPKPPPTGRRGRPRKQGNRIGTCKDAAAAADWHDVTVRIYGKEQKAQAAAWPCLWYGSFRDAPGQLVLTRLSELGGMGLAGQRAGGGFPGSAVTWADGVYSGLGERIAERGVHAGGCRRGLGRVPRVPLPPLFEACGRVAGDGVPADHQGLDEKRERDGPLDGPRGAVAGAAGAGDLLAGRVRGLDGPPPGVPLDRLLRGQACIEGEDSQVIRLLRIRFAHQDLVFPSFVPR